VLEAGIDQGLAGCTNLLVLAIGGRSMGCIRHKHDGAVEREGGALAGFQVQGLDEEKHTNAGTIGQTGAGLAACPRNGGLYFYGVLYCTVLSEEYRSIWCLLSSKCE
jgi:hypothetical protein